ncbi:hypothetical protein, partial [Methylobacterium sp. GC_Met_2]|uniref:PIN domain-containing protein n=1 Tax=Methylobacterium sp. GC_Met_2 TaxID=2937376 RepID=UPI00226B9993
ADGTVEAIKTHCCVEVALYPDESKHQANQAARSFGSQLMDAAILAQNHDAILLSDDGYYRYVVRRIMGVDGLWLQAVMDATQPAGGLEPEGYLKAAVEVAGRNHRHVMLNVNLMVGAFEAAQSLSLSEFDALADHVGTPDADRAAHFQFVVSILRRLWILGARYDILRLKRATGRLLEKLLRCYPLGHWSLVVLELFEQARGRARLQHYVVEWTRGHFLLNTVSSETSAAEATPVLASQKSQRRGPAKSQKANLKRRSMPGAADALKPRSMTGTQGRWS